MRRNERGAAGVETAVILALFLIPLLMGLVDVSRLIFTHISIQEAAQEGAMYYAFTESADDASAEAHAAASIDTPALDPADVEANCVGETRDGESFGVVTVKVELTVDMVFPLLGSSRDVSRTAQADRFYPCPGGP